MPLGAANQDGWDDVEHQRRLRQVLREGRQPDTHVAGIEVHQHPFAEQQHRFTVSDGAIHPVRSKERFAQVDIAGFRQQLAAQSDDFGQVKVVPSGDGRAAEALITRIQSRANLHHHGIRMGGDEAACLLVKQPGPPATARLRGGGFGVLTEIVVKSRQHLRRNRIHEQRHGLLLLDGLRPQRDEQGFGEDGEVEGDFVGHGASFLMREIRDCTPPEYTLPLCKKMVISPRISTSLHGFPHIGTTSSLCRPPIGSSVTSCVNQLFLQKIIF